MICYSFPWWYGLTPFVALGQAAAAHGLYGLYQRRRWARTRRRLGDPM